MISNLLNVTKNFKYQITVKGLLKKYTVNGEIEFAPVYFNTTTETAINHRFKLENYFQENLYLINNWIYKGSDWILKWIESDRPLSGISYISLPVELRSPKKGLINIKNKDQKCSLSYHVRHINPSKEHPGKVRKVDKKLVKYITNPDEITEEDKELISDTDYDEIEFSVQEKDFRKIEVKKNICINVFGYENELVFAIYVSDQNSKDSMDLLLLIDDDKSHYLHIKDFNRFMCHKTRNKKKLVL